jgi:predicted ATPase
VIAKRGDIDTGLRALRGELEQAGEARFLPRFLPLLGEMVTCLGQAGEVGRGLEIVDEALVRCEARDELWYMAELLRIKGELAILEGAAEVAAEGHFARALDVARRQQALSWELRAATSLARLWKDQRRIAEGRELLGSVYGRFMEGFDTADLRAAKSLLVRLT